MPLPPKFGVQTMLMHGEAAGWCLLDLVVWPQLMLRLIFERLHLHDTLYKESFRLILHAACGA